MPNTPEAEHPTQNAASRPRPRLRALDPGPRHPLNGAPAPEGTRDRYQQITERAGRRFLDALADLPEYKPRPGVELGHLHITVSVVGEPDLGSVDIDPVNLGDLADIVARRAEGLREKHARASRPTLRAVGSDSERAPHHHAPSDRPPAPGARAPRLP